MRLKWPGTCCSESAIPFKHQLIQDYGSGDDRMAVHEVASDFSARVAIHPIGVGVGERKILRRQWVRFGSVAAVQ
jgi:hypothetical protein